MLRSYACAFIALISFSTSAMAATAVGKIAGAFAVSDRGHATYTIPIKVAPGIAGMEPKLSLAYSSGGGNGLVGMGWSIAGISVITRCASNLAQDGAIRGVVFDAGDKFCLDGQKLRLTSGSYGAELSDYRTEIDSFMRIVASTGGAPGAVPTVGPQWFSAKTKDGVVIEYGATEDSRIEAQGKTVVRSWAVSKITDPHGNFIEFEYIEDAVNGSYRPSVVRYTGHTGQAARHALHFDYEARPATDINPEYVFGSLINETNRLIAIRLEFEGSEVWRYSLAYQPAASTVTRRSLLASVTYCAGADCLPPTTFGWTSGELGWGDLIPSATYAVDDSLASLAMDFNGDGREDLLYPAGGVWAVRFGKVDGTFDLPLSSTMSSANKAYAMVLDYDGDGRSDVLQPDGSPGNWQILRWTGTGLQVLQPGIPAMGILGAHFTADLNGDGLYDVIWIVPQSVTGANDELHIRWNSSAGFGNTQLLATFTGTGVRPFGAESSYFRSSVRRADINGDGQTDFFIFYSSSGQICDPELGCFPVTSNVWQGFLSLVPAFPRAYSLGGLSNSAVPPLMFDVNGDGNTDGGLVWSYKNYNYLTTKISKGDGTVAESQRYYPYTSAAHASVADWDGDGRDDILQQEWTGTEPELKVYRSNGAAFENGLWTGVTAYSADWQKRRVMDVNGDGLMDFVWHNGTTWETRLHRGGKADLLASVTDGFGNATSAVYAPLTAPDVYTKFAGASTPVVRDYQGPQYVVKTATSSDGIGGTYSLSYTYAGARVHTQGRGFLGFASVTAVDSRNGISSVRTFYQDFPYTGMLQEERLKLGGTTLAVTTYGVNKRQFGAGFETWGFPYVETTTGQQNEITGALVRTQASTNAFDDYGNLTDSSVSVSDSALNTFITDTHRDYQNDAGNWCLGRVTLESVTQTVPGQASQTRSKTATHDTAFCRLETTTEEPGSLQTLVEFDYDTWGNQSVIKVTGAGMATRQTNRVFAPFGVFPTEIYNAKGHKTSSTWNYALGVETSRTDANDLTVSWQHDGFGRPLLETRPDGTATQWSREYCSLGCGVSHGYYKVTAVVKNASTQQVGGTTYAVFDALDRPVRESRAMLLGQEAHMQAQYDALGRVYRKSAPYFAGGPVFWSTLSYDVLNRVTQENHPRSDTQPTGRLVSYAYNGLVSSVTDPLNRVTTRTDNARGEIKQVTDAANGSVQYTYWPFGELRTVTDHLGNTKTITYDVRGRKASMTDPDMGTWTYHHNALGELDTQTDAKQVSVTLLYDELGRPKTRYEPEGTTFWDYDNASGKGIGKLAAVRMEPPGGGTATFAEYFVYDGAGRLSEVTRDLNDGALYSVNTTYDALGRVGTLTYPDAGGSRFAVRYDYDASGMLAQVVNAATAQVFWHANSVNAFGQITEEQLGNNLLTTRTFDLARGHLDNINTGGGSVQNLAYAWDLAGNLTSRQDARQNLTESFSYDSLNRLDDVHLGGSLTLDLAYSAIGNITSKTDVGSYSYGTRPQAVTSAGSGSFSYDGNGNMASRSGTTVDWTSYNLPSRIAGPNGTDTFSYGPDRARYRHAATLTLAGGLLQAPQTTATDTVYVGNLYEKVTTLAVAEHRHHVMVHGRMVAQVTRKAAAEQIYYFHRDHQGSLDAITDVNGQVLARMSFDAFGQRRNPVTWSGAPTALELITIQAITSRGYTGHEMLDASGTIHMNGRVYDPALGRVLSADPTVPGAWNGQAHNRYSYALNSPLTLMDPTGFSPESPNPGYAGDVIEGCGESCTTITALPSSPTTQTSNGGAWKGGFRGTTDPTKILNFVMSLYGPSAQDQFARIRGSVDTRYTDTSADGAAADGARRLSEASAKAGLAATALDANFWGNATTSLKPWQRAYLDGWGGNQYRTTVAVGELGKWGGTAAAGVGLGADLYRWQIEGSIRGDEMAKSLTTFYIGARFGLGGIAAATTVTVHDLFVHREDTSVVDAYRPYLIESSTNYGP